MRNIFFLIGYPKTATTFLQKEIFPRLSRMKYLRSFESVSAEPLLLKVLHSRVREEDIHLIKNQVLGTEEADRILYVQESFATGAFGYFSENMQVRKIVLENLQRIFPGHKVKLLLGLREPSDMIRSLYLLHLHKGGYSSFERFLEKMNGRDPSACQGKFFDLFDYHLYVSVLYDMFKEENVYVYLFEDLKKDCKGFVKGILRFLDEPEDLSFDQRTHNRGYGTFEISVAKILNRFMKSSQNKKGFFPMIKIPGIGEISYRRFFQSCYFPKVFYKKYELSEDWKNRIYNRYKASNTNLRELISNLPEAYIGK